MRVLHLGDPEYPRRLRDSHPDPPREIYVRGELADARLCVAIVGSREADVEALDYANRLAARLAAQSVVVISGGALGIDGAAHEGALTAGVTWAVLPCGFDRPFPTAHADLFERVARGPGAVVSLVPPDTVAKSGAFPLRNGVLVALADVVVIVQARLRSGTRNAARWARRLGRPLWVVPSPPWKEDAFAGCVAELREGAAPLDSTEKLFASLGLAAEPVSPAQPARENEKETAILNALSRRPIHVDQIVSRTGLGAAELASLLLTLTLEDVVVEGPERCFRLRSST